VSLSSSPAITVVGTATSSTACQRSILSIALPAAPRTSGFELSSIRRQKATFAGLVPGLIAT
jgi:hypothetical protein